MNLYNEVNEWLIQVWISIGCDMPKNHNDICQYITSDVKETASETDYHSGDFAIAFRRFIETYEE